MGTHAFKMSTHNICFYKENQKRKKQKKAQKHCISIIINDKSFADLVF